jgi:hypothetical protein
LTGHHGERFPAAASRLKEHAFGPQHRFQELSVVDLVVHNQNSRLMVEDV